LSVSVEVLRTGARIRAATPDEVSAIEAARRGGEVVFNPSRSYSITLDTLVQDGEIRVVSQAFAEFTDGGPPERWAGREYHGLTLPTRRDATLELLELAREPIDDRMDALADLRIAGIQVTRWQIFSAPSVIELDAGLESQLAPLRRG
jgi:hypothetical protein